MLTASVRGLQSMFCAKCSVIWQGEENSPCWMCDKPGVPKMASGSPGWNQPAMVGGYTESYGDG